MLSVKFYPPCDLRPTQVLERRGCRSWQALGAERRVRFLPGATGGNSCPLCAGPQRQSGLIVASAVAAEWLAATSCRRSHARLPNDDCFTVFLETRAGKRRVRVACESLLCTRMAAVTSVRVR